MATSLPVLLLLAALLLPAGSLAWTTNCPPPAPGSGGSGGYGPGRPGYPAPGGGSPTWPSPGSGGGGHGHGHPPHHGKPPKHHGKPPTNCPPCNPPYTPPTPQPSPPYTPPTPRPSPPPTPPYVPPTPPYVPPTPPAVRTCPIDALKLNACVDVLGGLIHLVIGQEARSKCCPMVQGVADLDASLCLCTTIRARLLNINIYLPVALELLITCGKHAPPGFKCPPLYA
ncbi:unnamed protein product [Urochloa humidicola]